MNLSEHYNKHIPDYYPTMYLDGYTPQEILHAVRRKMHRNQEECQEA